MKRTNRIEPININTNELKYAVMTITTQMEVIRRTEVTPINEGGVRLQSNRDPPRTGHRAWTDKHCVTTPAAIGRARRALCCIGCLFITAGLLALTVVIGGLIIAFEKTNAVRENDIERYDLGDLHYGINNVDQMKFSPNTYLSNINKLFIQKYLSDQLPNEDGYRGLVIDSVFVRHQLITNRRKQRDSPCSIIFIIQNIQIYFDHCPTCINKRNLALRRFFSNITAFQQPFNLISNNFHIFLHICSTPNLPRLIMPIRLNVSYAQKINSSLLVVNTNLKSIPSLLKIRSQIPTTISIGITTTTTTKNPFKRIIDSTSTIDLIKTTSTDDLDQSISFTTAEFDSSQTTNSPNPTYIPSLKNLTSSRRQLSLTTKNSFQRTTASMFQFLPFKPSTTIFPRRNTLLKRSIAQRYDNLFAMLKIITNRSKSSTQRRSIGTHTSNVFFTADRKLQATTVTHYQSTISKPSLLKQSIMTIDSTISTDKYRETSFSSSPTETDVTMNLSTRNI